MSPTTSQIFVVGGKVQAAGGIYIERQADQELLSLCRSGGFGVVLHCRQIGKSSLIAHVSTELKQSGVQTAVLDLTRLGTHGLTAEQWYLAFLDLVCSQFEETRDFDVADWWHSQAHLSIIYRFSTFLGGPLLERIKQQVVIFVDEIDTTLSLDFTDDFFATVRELYQRRDESPEVRRLSFVFAGASTPDNLMKDASRTPFNIGRRIEILDFSLEETLRLAEGLPLAAEDAERALQQVHAWTQGHPYLTQKLCAHLATKLQQESFSETMVPRAVEQLLLGPEGAQDSNLNYVREMLTERAERLVGSKAAVLEVYRSVLRDTRMPDDPQSNICMHLKLSGVVVAQNGCLKVRNPIYRSIFNRRWIRQQMPFDWGLVGKLSAAVLLVGLAAAAYTFLVWSPYRKDLAAIELIRQQFAYVDDEKEARQLFEILCGRLPDPKTNRRLPPHPAYADSSFSRFWSKRAEAIESLAAGEQEPEQRLLRLALAGIKRDMRIPLDVVRTFNRRYESAVTVLRGHRGSPTAVAFSDDKSTVVTGGADGVIKLWRTGATWWPGLEHVREIPFQSAGTPLYKPNMLALQEAPGRQLLTAVSDVGLVMVWALEQASSASPGVVLSHYTGARRDQVKVGALEPYTPRAALVDPKGTWLLITGGALEHVPLEGGKAVSRELPLGQDAAWNAEFLPGSNARFATTGARGAAPLWDARLAPAGSLRLGSRGRRARVTTLQFSPDGRWFLAGAENGDTVLGDVATQTPAIDLPQQEGPVAFARFCCLTPGSCWPKELHEALLLTVVHAQSHATVRLWKIPLPAAAPPDRPFHERTFPGGTFATSIDCTLFATIGGAVDNAEIDGVVLREPWTTAKPSDDPRAILLDWQRLLRKRIDDTGKIEDLVDPESLRPVERLQTAGCEIFPGQ